MASETYVSVLPSHLCHMSQTCMTYSNVKFEFYVKHKANMMSRYWLFTINNPNEEDIPTTWEYRYLVYQKEKGDSGTEHYQGYVIFKNNQRLSAVKKINVRAHWEIRKGTHEQAYAYCTKEETRVEGPFVFGDEPKQGRRTDLEEATTHLLETRNVMENKQLYPSVWVRYPRGMNDLLTYPPRDHNIAPIVTWIYGPTGSGKTRMVYDTEKDIYPAPFNMKWWNGYTQQETVLIDDFRSHRMMFSDLLVLLDRYPLQLETKGGFIQFNSPKIYITSAFSPSEIYDKSDEDMKQLLRRITRIINLSYKGENNPLYPYGYNNNNL